MTLGRLILHSGHLKLKLQAAVALQLYTWSRIQLGSVFYRLVSCTMVQWWKHSVRVWWSPITISVHISCKRHMREWIQGLDKYEHYYKFPCHLRRNKAYMIQCWKYVCTYVYVKMIYLPNNGCFLQICVFQVSGSTKALAPAIYCYKSLLLLCVLIGLLACVTSRASRKKCAVLARSRLPKITFYLMQS